MASGRRIFPSFFRDLNGPGVHMCVCVYKTEVNQNVSCPCHAVNKENLS